MFDFRPKIKYRTNHQTKTYFFLLLMQFFCPVSIRIVFVECCWFTASTPNTTISQSQSSILNVKFMFVYMTCAFSNHFSFFHCCCCWPYFLYHCFTFRSTWMSLTLLDYDYCLLYIYAFDTNINLRPFFLVLFLRFCLWRLLNGKPIFIHPLPLTPSPHYSTFINLFV